MSGSSDSRFIPVSCTDNCNGNGICVFSVCQCDPAYMGASCDERKSFLWLDVAKPNTKISLKSLAITIAVSLWVKVVALTVVASVPLLGLVLTALNVSFRIFPKFPIRSNCRATERCPDDCSANGDCDTSNYTCTCKEFWTGDNCGTSRKNLKKALISSFLTLFCSYSRLQNLQWYYHPRHLHP